MNLLIQHIIVQDQDGQNNNKRDTEGEWRGSEEGSKLKEKETERGAQVPRNNVFTE